MIFLVRNLPPYKDILTLEKIRIFLLKKELYWKAKRFTILKFGQAFLSLRGAGAESCSLTEQIIVEK